MNANDNKIRTNLIDYYKLLATSDHAQKINNRFLLGFASHVGPSFLNPIIEQNIINAELDLIALLKEFAQKYNNTSFGWWQEGSFERCDLKEKYGFEYQEGSLGMILKNRVLNNIRETSFDKGIKIDITDDLELWVKTAMLGFDIKSKKQIQNAINLFKGIKGDDKLINILGYYKQKPVTTVQLFVSKKVAGIYWVSTKKRARNKGIATQTIKKAILEAKNKNIKTIILHSSKMAESLYENMGFKRLGRMQHYLLR